MASLVVATCGVPPALSADGDLDATFGDAGVVTTVFPVGSFATAVATQADGKIVAVGAAAGPSETGEFALVRYDENGTLDPSFGVSGLVTTPIAGGGDEARSVAIQENGRIVVAGTDSWRRFAVIRYRPTGVLDESFGGGDGIVRTNFTRGDDVAFDVAIQPDGKIVAVGGAGFGMLGFQLARYRRDGTLDPAFGDDGKVVTGYERANARTVTIQSNGRIVLAGYNTTGFAMARYRPDGRLDRSFSDNGTIDHVFGTWSPLRNLFAGAVALQPDGRIVAAGGYDIFEIGLARFRTDGSLDRTFNGDGVMHIHVDGVEQSANGLVIQPDGRIVASGYAGPHEFADPDVFRFVLIRALRRGHLDRTFGDRGRVATFFEGGAFAYGATADADGRVVVVGGAEEGNRGSFALARYVV
ncbi:MAG TPA: hypothetical protein VFP09_02565 [Desertimonas sp.]|nr:hypothetical protein [Desertimonas sp.]